MTVLNAVSRVEIWVELMRDFSSNGESIGVTKPELKAAIDALDDFLDGNAATINTAIPHPARDTLTAQQKALMLSYVVLKSLMAMFFYVSLRAW